MKKLQCLILVIMLAVSSVSFTFAAQESKLPSMSARQEELLREAGFPEEEIAATQRQIELNNLTEIQIENYITSKIECYKRYINNATIVDFPVTINYEKYNGNFNDYTSNDMSLCEYPMVTYKNIVYIPLTYYNCVLLGINVQLIGNELIVKKSGFETPTEYLRDQSYPYNSNKTLKNVTTSHFTVNIYGNDYSDEEYPAIFYKNIVYLPLTFNVVNNIMQWDYSFSEKGLELYTDSYYYYSTGDSYFELIGKDGLAATVSYATTYYKKDDISIYAYIDGVRNLGPMSDNMVIFNEKNKITVPCFTGYGQNKGPLFTVNEEYIYTVHSDLKKYAPCKIKISTGEITYLDD